MLDLALGRASRLCSGTSRRDFLRVGGLGALSLPLLLQAEAQAKKETTPAKPNKARAKSVILVYLGGGMTHHDTFDPKPDAPEEIRGKYTTIATRVTDLRVSEKLPLMAKQMDKIALVRGGAHNNDHHETATNWVLSGRFGTPFGDYPAIGAVSAHHFGFTAALPPYVSVPRNPSFTWNSARARSSAGGTSRSRPATRTRRTTRFKT